ncbi:uncharacterized protein LOC104878128 isoform X1 [Vitis vinifera]|uniref:uncharacterized protein LOC104878128 isoform X1 n=1 Tax=Vitis vinifera TaxID=29760 RepID=UPI0028831F53|nr:uncharacterized protein LOC104878128 isoform X1 [Vitis vinifera]
MSEKRPDFGLEEELKRRLKLDGSATTSAANRETLKPSMGKGNQGKEMKRKVKFDVPASGSAANQEILKPPTQKRNQDKEMKRKVKSDAPASTGSVANREILEPPMEKRNQDKEMKRKVRFHVRESTGSVANQETLKPPMEKRNQDKKMKRKVKFDVPASTGSVANQKTLKPPTEKTNQGKEMKRKVTFDLPASGSVANEETLKPPREKKNQVDEDGLKAQMGERSSTSLSLPRSTSKDQTPTLLWKKKLTCDDLHAGNLKVPAGLFVAKRRRDRMMVVPFLDNKGAVWEMQASYHGLSLNWNKFAKEHGLQPNDVIFFYDDDSISEYYIIHYEKSGEGHSESSFYGSSTTCHKFSFHCIMSHTSLFLTGPRYGSPF